MFTFEFSWKVVSCGRPQQEHSIMRRSWHSLPICYRRLTTSVSPLPFVNRKGQCSRLLQTEQQPRRHRRPPLTALSAEWKGHGKGGPGALRSQARHRFAVKSTRCWFHFFQLPTLVNAARMLRLVPAPGLIVLIFMAKNYISSSLKYFKMVQMVYKSIYVKT